MLAFAFTELGLPEVVSIARTGNTALQWVMAKPGMRPVRETIVPATGLSVRVDPISRPHNSRPRPPHPTHRHARLAGWKRTVESTRPLPPHTGV